MIEIYADTNEIRLDGIRTGLRVVQERDRTVVYTGESLVEGTQYRDHQMPHSRYALTCEQPISPNGVPGLPQLEADIRALLISMARTAIESATTTLDLSTAVERYLAAIGERKNARGESYIETAERLDDDLMRLAEGRWWELENQPMAEQR